jgi:hypothetical protein
MKITSLSINLFHHDGHHTITASKSPIIWSVRLDNVLVCQMEEIDLNEICHQCGLSVSDIHNVLV